MPSENQDVQVVPNGNDSPQINGDASPAPSRDENPGNNQSNEGSRLRNFGVLWSQNSTDLSWRGIYDPPLTILAAGIHLRMFWWTTRPVRAIHVRLRDPVQIYPLLQMVDQTLMVLPIDARSYDVRQGFPYYDYWNRQYSVYFEFHATIHVFLVIRIYRDLINLGYRPEWHPGHFEWTPELVQALALHSLNISI